MPRPSSFWLTCPNCQEACDMYNRALFHPGHNIQLWCGKCKRLASCRKWACICGHSWMSCNIHRPLGFTCRSRLSLKPKVKSGLAKGLACHRACMRRRKVAALGELGSDCPPVTWPLPPPLPSGPLGPAPRKKRCLPPAFGAPLGPLPFPGPS